MGQVSTLEVLPVAQGKRLQTGTCRTFTEKIYVDVREEQSWTLPGGGQMLNLYQRQCLTLDRHSTHLDHHPPGYPIHMQSSSNTFRDALPGLRKEVWLSPLLGGDFAVLLFNKGEREELVVSAMLFIIHHINVIHLQVELTLAMVGGEEQQRYRVRDLWAHEDSKQLLTKMSPVEKLLPAHAAALLRLSPVQ
jgi:hypothetical protein